MSFLNFWEKIYLKNVFILIIYFIYKKLPPSLETKKITTCGGRCRIILGTYYFEFQCHSYYQDLFTYYNLYGIIYGYESNRVTLSNPIIIYVQMLRIELIIISHCGIIYVTQVILQPTKRANVLCVSI